MKLNMIVVMTTWLPRRACSHPGTRAATSTVRGESIVAGNVTSTGTSRGSITIVRTVIDLAHRLGLTAVADGIDTVEVLDRVRMLDCDSALGAMAGVPMDVDGLEAFVLAMTPVEAAAEIPLPD